ncbi:MAG: hypothetical protein JO015_15360 [Verrucomicrobia bacterium]|nr:hypothetical protein [Verrucomicrobiota bacterium]
MRLIEKILVTLFLVLLGIPGILGLAFSSIPGLPLEWRWLQNGSLAGVRQELKPTRLTSKSWFRTAFQEFATKKASETFFGRDMLIRSLNEVLYRGFRKSYMSGETLIVGNHRDLFQLHYLAYFGHLAPSASEGYLQHLTDDIVAARQRFRRLGSEIIVMITPSKTSLYPEDVPDRFRAHPGKDAATPAGYRRLAALLQQKGVPLVDGRALSLQRVHELPGRGFAKTGIHWTYPLACFTVQAVLDELGRLKGTRYASIEQRNLRVDHSPEGVDQDLFSLLNLLERPKESYLHADFRVSDEQAARPHSLTFVGGSFTHEIIEVIERSRAAGHVAYYNYFDTFVEHWPEQSLVQRPEVAQIPWERDFARADAVVLEVNEAAIVSSSHLTRFLQAAPEYLERVRPEARPDLTVGAVREDLSR